MEVLLVILGATIGIIGTIIGNAMLFNHQNKDYLRKKKEEIYLDFLSMNKNTIYLLNNEELKDELNKNCEEKLHQNSLLASRCELFLNKKMLTKVRKIVAFYGRLYKDEIPESKEFSDVQSVYDEVLDQMRKDLGIKE